MTTTPAARAAALRRAGRLTAAGCTGFLVLRYGLGAPVTATYALFTVIALGALSEVAGPPPVRTRTLAAAGAAGLVLVTAGTFAARSTAAAAAGMLVVGFAVAYAGVGGPRVAGVATGLQLFYVLPCFPPFAPGALADRLAGLAAGAVLLAVADRLLWPAPAPVPFAERLAACADVVARYVAAVRADLLAGAAPGGGAGSAALREEAGDATRRLRLYLLPLTERPAGPGRRDRGLTQAAGCVRVVAARTSVAAGLLGRPAGPAAVPDATAGLLAAVSDVLAAAAAALRGCGPPPEGAPLEQAVDGHRRARLAALAAHDGPVTLGPGLRGGVAAGAVAEAARLLVAATRAAVGAPPDPTAPPPPTAWYVRTPTAVLWARRLRAHLTPRSVWLENAVRLALGLAAARVVAGVLDLSHGFWVLLATLTLMRTSAAASRAALLPALAGTLLGAALAGGLLTVVGAHDVVYAAALPAGMLLALCAGPLLGPLAGQAGFTVLVSVLFAQVAPVSWRLAEVRLVDVVVGGAVGAAIGAAVWPRGSALEVRRAAAGCLRAGAATVPATVAALCDGRRVPLPDTRPTALLDATYAQHRSEPSAGGPEPDWLVLLGVAHRLLGDAQTLRSRFPDAGPLPWPGVAAALRDGAAAVAEGYRAAAAGLAPGGTAGTRAPAADRLAALDRSAPRADVGTDPDAGVRALDVWGWLHALAADLQHVAEATGAPPPGAVPATAAAGARR